MNKSIKRLFSGVMATAFAVMALTACGDSESTGSADVISSDKEATTENASEGMQSLDDIEGNTENNGVVADSVTMAIQSYATLSPWGTNVAYEYNAEVYEYLFAQDSNSDTFFPVLADASRGEFGGYDHEAGTGDYTVYIYDYIHDSEGNKITASDVKFSFEYQKENATTSGWQTFQGVEVVDDTTCIFHFDRELNKIGELKNVWARCVIVSEAGFNASPSALASDMCGTGPYKLKEYSSGAKVVLEINDDYWQTNEELLTQRQMQNVKEITYVFQDDAAQQIIGLQTGDIDVVPNVSSSSLTDFTTGSYAADFNVTEWLQLGVRYIAANCSSDSLCGDVNLRNAIFYAIDNNGLAAALGSGTSEPCHSMISSAFPEYDTDWESWDNYMNVTDYDLAKEYLEKSSYNGEELVLMCESVYNPAAEIIQSMCLQVGINVKIANYDKSTLTDLKGKPAEWDLIIDNNAGDAGYTQLQHVWDVSIVDGTRTENYIVDSQWQDMLDAISTIDGTTKENWDAWMQHCYDNAYGKALISEVNHIVTRSNIVSVVRTDKNKLMPGGFIYSE